MQLAKAIECYVLLAEQERRLSPRTVTLYKDALARLLAFAVSNDRARVADLTPNLVRAAAAAEMSAEGRAPNWKGGEGMAITLVIASRAMVKRLHEEYPDISLPDLSMVKAPKLPERIQPRLQEGEFAALEAAIRMRLLRDRVPRYLIARDTAILQVLANTGLRASEMCALDLDDVDLNEGCIRVLHGKGGKWRILTVRDPDEPRDGGEVIRSLTDYLHWRERTFGPGRTAALWLTQKGNRLKPNDLRDALRSLCDEAGIDGNRPPHAFRRSHFTDQYREMPNQLPTLIERMGWSSATMARIYTRGVDVELARRVQLPLVSRKWREAARAQAVTRTQSRFRAGLTSDSYNARDVGPARMRDDAPDLPSPVRADRRRRGGQLP